MIREQPTDPNDQIFWFQYYKASLKSEPSSSVIRLQDWMTADNPFIRTFPEIVEGRWPNPDLAYEERIPEKFHPK